ncbi:MAG: hypothetical protein GY754_41180 [bacterium]|nr:hypothetical protein [bacterium]
MSKFFLFTVLLFILSCSSDSNRFDEKQWQTDVNSQDRKKLYTKHVEDDTFFNPWNPEKGRGCCTIVKWRFTFSKPYSPEEDSHLPKVIPNPLERIRALGNKDFILWVGHNTFLIRINGTYWITDPNFAGYTVLLKRKTPPGISIDEIKKLTNKINIVISHNHYDHLNEESIKDLSSIASAFVPLGLENIMHHCGIKSIHELDWWQELPVAPSFKLLCLPAQHWSLRVGHTRNSSLWAAFLLKTENLSIFIGGDSGYFIGYKEFGDKLGSIDYALLPTTAYHPRWFMHYSHMNVNEALLAFKDLKARFFIPTQWGTFHLGDEPPGFPGLDLARLVKKKNLNPQQFLIMDVGEIVVIKR